MPSPAQNRRPRGIFHRGLLTDRRPSLYLPPCSLRRVRHRPTKEGAMRHLRLLVLATVAVVLCAPSAARAHDPHKQRSGTVITPSKGKYLGEAWAQLFALPLSENPLRGQRQSLPEGGARRDRGGARRSVHPQAGHGADARLRQRVEQRGTAVSGDRGRPTCRGAGRRRAVHVDHGHGRPRPAGRDPRRRFEVFSRQRTVQLPEDNILDGLDPEFPEVPARIVTFTTHGWIALVHNLRPGRHKIVLAALYAGEPFEVKYDITVVRR